jgi:hypothetical protein
MTTNSSANSTPPTVFPVYADPWVAKASLTRPLPFDFRPCVFNISARRIGDDYRPLQHNFLTMSKPRFDPLSYHRMAWAFIILHVSGVLLSFYDAHISLLDGGTIFIRKS